MNTQKQLNGKSGVTMAATAFGRLIASALVALAVMLALTARAQTMELFFSSSLQFSTFNGTIAGGSGGYYVGIPNGYRIVVAGDFDDVDFFVNGSFIGSFAANNVVRVDVNTNSPAISAYNMGGGINGAITWAFQDGSGTLYLVGDFDSVGGGSNFYDFAIGYDGSLSWDTCNAQLLGYNGYAPARIDNLGGGILQITLAQPVDAYGGIVDDINGWQVIPWTTATIEWNASGQYWQNWND